MKGSGGYFDLKKLLKRLAATVAAVPPGLHVVVVDFVIFHGYSALVVMVIAAVAVAGVVKLLDWPARVEAMVGAVDGL